MAWARDLPTYGKTTGPSKAAKAAMPDLARMSNKAIKAYVRAGLPKTHRLQLWLELSGALSLKNAHGCHYFESLIDRSQALDMQYDAETAVCRWLPAYRPQLRHIALGHIALIVQTFTKHSAVLPEENLYIIAAFLAIETGPDQLEDAFWLMTALFNKILPQIFTDQETSSERGHLQSRVLAAFVENRMPKIGSAMKSASISVISETSAWCSNFFIGILPYQTVVRIWDALLFEGEKVLYRVGLALLKMQEASLVNKPSLLNLRWHIGKTSDVEPLFKMAFHGIGSFPGSEISRLEHLLAPQVKMARMNQTRRLEALLSQHQMQL